MKKNLFLFFASNCFTFFKAQITIIGHNELNGMPLLNTTISVREDGKLKEDINTKKWLQRL